MRIAFLSHYFPPEVNAPANRTFEHCREWVRLGHEVHVVTCIPSHPRGVPFPGYRRRWYQRELVDGIHVHRVWTFLAANRGVVRRTINYLSFVPTAVWRVLQLPRCDVLIATSPQFFCAVAGWSAAAMRKWPWVFELRDLWPESVVSVGAVRRTWILRLAERLELFLYRRASRVVCVSRAFMDNLARRGVSRERLVFVPNGVEPGDWSGGDGGAVRRKAGFSAGDVVVSYIGTVGMAHAIGTVLDAAEQLFRSAPRVRFMIVGDGAELDSIRRGRQGRGLDNVTITGLVEHRRIPDFLAASDIALVLLRDSPTFASVLPSKMFEAMAASRPIVLGVRGEAEKVLEDAGAGVAITPQSARDLVSAIVRLSEDAVLRREMGERGRDYVSREFNREAWARRYLEMLAGVVAGYGPAEAGAA